MTSPTNEQGIEPDLHQKKAFIDKGSVAFFFFAVCFLILLLEAASSIILSRIFLPASPWPFFAHMVQHETRGWTVTPYVTYRIVNYPKGYDVTYRTNKSFRVDGQNIDRAKDADIVLIGSSHIFGYGLTDDETLSAQLHTLLSAKGRPSRVLNAGVPGYGPGQYYQRLLSLGRLTRDTVVVVHVSPTSSLGVLSMDIAFGHPKSHASLRRGRLTFSKPLAYDPQLSFHFAQPFERLNQEFAIPNPAPVPPIVRLSRRSATSRLVSALQEGTIRTRWSELEPSEYIGPVREGEKFEQWRHQHIRSHSLRNILGLWPLISKLEPERKIIQATLQVIFRAMKKHVESQGAHLLIVVARESHLDQAYSIAIGQIFVEQFPEYEFQPTWPRNLVLHTAQQEGISTLVAPYPRDSLERMYVPYDSHTSGEGFAVVAEEIVKWIAANELTKTGRVQN